MHCVPPERHVGVNCSCECDLIGNRIKMRALEWAQIQCDWHPSKKGNLGPKHHMHREKRIATRDVMVEAEVKWGQVQARNTKNG